MKFLIYSACAWLAVNVLVCQGQEESKCRLGFEGELQSACLDANNLNLQTMVKIMNDTRPGVTPDPANQQQKELMCRKETQDSTVVCIEKLLQKWNMSTCSPKDRQELSGSGGQFLEMMDIVCRMSSCNTPPIEKLVQCHQQSQLDPSSLLNPNMSIISDKFTLVGKTPESAKLFCAGSTGLSNCIKGLQIETTCPDFIERYNTLGLNLNSLWDAFAHLCGDLNSYGNGLQCLAKPNADLIQCQQQAEGSLQKAFNDRFVLGTIKPSEFLENLLAIKLPYLGCTFKALTQSCEASVISYMTKYECLLLPQISRDSANLKPQYDGLCSNAGPVGTAGTADTTVSTGFGGTASTGSPAPL